MHIDIYSKMDLSELKCNFWTFSSQFNFIVCHLFNFDKWKFTWFICVRTAWISFVSLFWIFWPIQQSRSRNWFQCFERNVFYFYFILISHCMKKKGFQCLTLCILFQFSCYFILLDFSFSLYTKKQTTFNILFVVCQKKCNVQYFFLCNFQKYFTYIHNFNCAKKSK